MGWKNISICFFEKYVKEIKDFIKLAVDKNVKLVHMALLRLIVSLCVYFFVLLHTYIKGKGGNESLWKSFIGVVSDEN